MERQLVECLLSEVGTVVRGVREMIFLEQWLVVKATLVVGVRLALMLHIRRQVAVPVEALGDMRVRESLFEHRFVSLHMMVLASIAVLLVVLVVLAAQQHPVVMRVIVCRLVVRVIVDVVAVLHVVEDRGLVRIDGKLLVMGLVIRRDLIEVAVVVPLIFAA